MATTWTRTLHPWIPSPSIGRVSSPKVAGGGGQATALATGFPDKLLVSRLRGFDGIMEALHRLQ